MKAITTTFKGPTDTRGSRILARDGDGQRITLPYPHELDTVDAHKKAARTLMEKMGWQGTLKYGWVGHSGIDYAFVNN